ncbi:MAG TPA: DUF3617 family protein [Steroidobacteraceae bacterium]|nr:DUF3617 family protein [Steroidobacteraceae bacterium]
MKRLASILIGISIVSFTAHADGAMESLKLFKSGGMQHGKWQIEMLEGSDPKMAGMLKQAGNMSICIDIAKQLSKDYQRENQTNSCTHKVIKDSSDSAEVEVTCESGSHIHSLITRENDKTYTADSTISTRDQSDRHMKFRYTYQGECTGDGLVQFDKNSPMCKMVREKSQGKDMTAMCARLQDKMREQCEQNMKNAMASCQ